MRLKPLDDHLITPIKLGSHRLLAEIGSGGHPPVHHVWKELKAILNFQRFYELFAVAFRLVLGTERQQRHGYLGCSVLWKPGVQLHARLVGRVFA
jgi:hypothetical protein